MPRRDSEDHLAASYQLLASYLLGDLEDLLEGVGDDRPARRRVGQLLEILDSAVRAGEPAYPAPSGPGRSGAARAERSKRLASRDSDQELLWLVAAAHAAEPTETANWAVSVRRHLGALDSSDWSDPSEEDFEFVDKELRPFLRRLQRIDEIDGRRSGRSGGLARR